MNKNISSQIAIAIVIFFALVAYVVIWIFSKNFETYVSAMEIPQIQSVAKEKCKVHAYKGNATIHVWQIKENEERLLQVKNDDVAKLPSIKAEKIKLIDAPNETQLKLATSSESNPIEIKISGFASKCDNIFLASLEYKEGIFRPYLSIN